MKLGSRKELMHVLRLLRQIAGEVVMAAGGILVVASIMVLAGVALGLHQIHP